MATITLQAAALCIVFFLSTPRVSGSYPQAWNVTWKSTNFKTFLTWEPKPSPDYSYTVEFSQVGGNKQRTQYCIRSSATTCDLSNSLTDLKACYVADVLSEPPQGVISDQIEFPHKSSPKFCPYKDTDIDSPDFKLEVSKGKATLTVTDSLTAHFKDGVLQNIRDIFSEELQYKVTYWKNKSTGKKVWFSKTSVIEMTNLDQGESYCFQVQAYIPSRSFEKQLGEMSQTLCSKDDDQSIFKVYSPAVIISTIVLILLLIGIIITVIVICCKQRKKVPKSEKKGVV
ncbi:coagulation factor III, tissue factor a [Archocentrus centrarchus]|uniref:coagulation factor III, tissue factor a n=1 Tax=Archocentrus centrarchus TaxID=63155 RepID=UPI0011EA4778|nr:tissue factor [Archocentrus centrarchus]